MSLCREPRPLQGPPSADLPDHVPVTESGQGRGGRARPRSARRRDARRRRRGRRLLFSASGFSRPDWHRERARTPDWPHGQAVGTRPPRPRPRPPEPQQGQPSPLPPRCSPPAPRGGPKPESLPRLRAACSAGHWSVGPAPCHPRSHRGSQAQSAGCARAGPAQSTRKGRGSGRGRCPAPARELGLCFRILSPAPFALCFQWKPTAPRLDTLAPPFPSAFLSPYFRPSALRFYRCRGAGPETLTQDERLTSPLPKSSV